MELSKLDNVQTICLAYIILKKKQKQHKKQRRYWVHPLNTKRLEEGQFQVLFMTLRSYPEEFYKYYRMSITSFDELVGNYNYNTTIILFIIYIKIIKINFSSHK